jgi:CRP/FNR family transcriptional regulator
MDIDRILQTKFLFREPELRQKIQENGKLVTYEANTVILDTGDYIKVMPLMLGGVLKVLREEEEKKALLYYAKKYESCLMSIDACFQNEPSKITAVIEEKATMLLIPIQYVTKWQMLYPSWNEFILRMYKLRFDELLGAFNKAVFHHIDQRLIEYLLQKAKMLNTNSIKVTHQQIANELNTAREVVSRTLKQLENQGYISLLRGQIDLHNINELTTSTL